MKKVGKTSRPFRYDLNQIPYDFTVEVRSRFKGLDLIDRVPNELWTEVRDIVQETGIKTIPMEKKCKKAKWLSEETFGEGNGKPLKYSCLENPMDGGVWWAPFYGVAKSRSRLSDFIFTFHFHAMEKEMATHSSVLAWRIPGTAETSGLLSMGSHRVGHD